AVLPSACRVVSASVCAAAAAAPVAASLSRTDPQRAWPGSPGSGDESRTWRAPCARQSPEPLASVAGQSSAAASGEWQAVGNDTAHAEQPPDAEQSSGCPAPAVRRTGKTRQSQVEARG